MKLEPSTVRHLDLAEPISELPADGRGAFVVFWYRGIPLGLLHVEADRLPLSAEEVAGQSHASVAEAVWSHLFASSAEAYVAPPAADYHQLTSVTAPLEAVYQQLRLAPDLASDVSVVICTRDRPAQLAGCLDTLQRLRYAPLEIVVVDNASKSAATSRLVQERPKIRYVWEPRPGLDIARNTGVRESRGGIVAFADDDVEFDPDWVARVESAFADESVMAMTGLVLPAELDTEAQALFEARWSLGRNCSPRIYGPRYFALTRRKGARTWEIGAGANMAFRRSVFDDVGLFDERLDVGAAGCSGDSELWYRILAAGHRIRYEPTAVVHHYHRRELPSFRRQIRAYMRGHTAALLIQFEGDRSWGNLRRLLLVLPWSFVRTARDRLALGPTPAASTLGDEVLGVLSGLRYYLAHLRPTRPG